MNKTHYRRCWDCGYEGAFTSDAAVPNVLCPKCKSQDTRRRQISTRIDASLGAVRDHLQCLVAHRDAGRYRQASRSATLAAQRLLEIVDGLALATDEEPPQ